MLTPEYLQGLPAELEKLYLRLEEETIADICRRIAKVGHISDTAEYQILRMRELGAGTEYIKSKIKEYSGLSDDVVDRLFFDAAQVSDEFYKGAYAKAGKEYKPFEYNDFFQQIVVANVNQTKGELSNLTQSMGFSYRGSNGERRFRPVATAYRECLDYAFTQVETGTTDYITAIRNATRRLTESGLQFVDYDSGVVNHVDVAVRRAVLTGISQVTGRISEHNAAELETDIVEVTAHAGARPDHAEWQGGWYSLSGKSKKYRSLAEATGYGRVDGLKGANCRHDFFPVIEGIDVPLYTKEELANIDPPPFEYNGKRYTYYEATQKQRSMERAIRKNKREILAADKTGDKDRFTEKSIRLRRQREEYDKFSISAGLLTQNERNQVVGFGRSEASRASWAARSAQTSGNGPKGTPPSGSSSSTSSQGSPFQTNISQNNAMGKTNQIVVDKPSVTSDGNEMFRGLTNNNVSGKIQEREREYGVAYGKYSITPDMEYIKSAEYKQKFQNATTNSNVNTTLYECSLRSIEHRAGTYKEDMYIIHAETGEILAKQLDSPCEQGIIYNEEIKAALIAAKEKNIPIIALHNHPEGYPPSVDDINKAFDNNYVYGFVNGHNGQVYRYTKPLERVSNADEIHDSIAFLCQNGADVDRAYSEIYESNNLRYDIIRGD